MRIAFIGGRDIRKLGGIENYMYNLATKLVGMGHEPIVYCESDHNGEEIINGFKVIYQRSIGGRYLCKILLSYRATIRSLFGRHRADIFHYNAWPPSLASWIPRMFGRKTILQGHGLEWKRTKYSSLQQKIMKFMEWFTAKTNPNLIMVSQEQTDFFAREYNRQCTTIPTAVNIPTSSGISADILKKYGIQPDGYFLYMGRLVQDKNPDYLIRAYQKTNCCKQLVIAGDNQSDKSYVQKLHNMADNSSDIIFTGAVYGKDKAALLKYCHAFCIPSTIEGLPITLLEAMSYGKLCIASDIPANREALGKSGIWCRYEDIDDLAEKLAYSISSEDELSWQKEYNVNRIMEYYTWDKIAEKYDCYIKSI